MGAPRHRRTGLLPEPDGESPKGGTGFGVRTLLTLLESWGDEMELLEELEELEAELG